MPASTSAATTPEALEPPQLPSASSCGPSCHSASGPPRGLRLRWRPPASSLAARSGSAAFPLLEPLLLPLPLTLPFPLPPLSVSSFPFSQPLPSSEKTRTAAHCEKSSQSASDCTCSLTRTSASFMFSAVPESFKIWCPKWLFLSMASFALDSSRMAWMFTPFGPMIAPDMRTETATRNKYVPSSLPRKSPSPCGWLCRNSCSPHVTT
mmetsp:Transcript_121549/g.355221  ORF Transcript_121549/g.355221 Transcript_121549/m.355221 type:complete len:208 (-) Transcript_121549:328-951(-)